MLEAYHRVTMLEIHDSTVTAYCDSCNNDIYYEKMDFANMVLAVYNRERAAVGVPPLVWSDTLASGRQDLGRASGDDRRVSPRPRHPTPRGRERPIHFLRCPLSHYSYITIPKGNSVSLVIYNCITGLVRCVGKHIAKDDYTNV